MDFVRNKQIVQSWSESGLRLFDVEDKNSIAHSIASHFTNIKKEAPINGSNVMQVWGDIFDIKEEFLMVYVKLEDLVYIFEKERQKTKVLVQTVPLNGISHTEVTYDNEFVGDGKQRLQMVSFKIYYKNGQEHNSQYSSKDVNTELYDFLTDGKFW
ncbi:hypothetical protein [Staphylococcus pseudoxylosus]|uniref:hypothetical protein n=1 Tax=Staphylococcus pseudoxylosus TaxID=2282419 RepID=UPI002DBF0B61|nr:hypothetical protein [Staphylococcus pseudoxylosus]MEB7753298.1 hypothetical protein [Staphylococcus pseudoxylosus]